MGFRMFVAGARALAALAVVASGLVAASQGAEAQGMQARRPASDFVVPASMPPKIAASFTTLAGKQLQWEDAYSKGTVNLSPDGSFSYSDDLDNAGITGMWWVNPKQEFCLTSMTFWYVGQCFELHGSSLEALTGMKSTRMEIQYFPAEFVQ
jgi:hypothetical protein